MTTKPITPPQIKALRAAAQKWFPDLDTYRAFLYETYRVNSTKELSSMQASDAIAYLRKKLFYKEKEVRPNGGRTSGALFISAPQILRIRCLEILLGWNADARRLDGFITRQTKKQTAVHMLQSWEAKKVITGMTRILADGREDIFRMINSAKFGDPDTDEGREIIATMLKNLYGGIYPRHGRVEMTPAQPTNND